MTTEARLRELLDQADLPWETDGEYVNDRLGDGIGNMRAKAWSEGDATLIVAAVNALPKLLAVVEAARAVVVQSDFDVDDWDSVPSGAIDAARAALAALDTEGGAA